MKSQKKYGHRNNLINQKLKMFDGKKSFIQVIFDFS